MAHLLDALVFDNRFTSSLTADPDAANVPRQVHRAMFTRVQLTPTAAPELVAHSREIAQLLGVDDAVESPEFAEVVTGNRVLAGMDPHAMAYGGHQFGNWAGQLGDGRAVNLGELLTGSGDRFMLQLKGAGRTPYSRGADGRAVLRSSVREFLCSEAMHHLGVPTTRALSLAVTGDQVVRDMFYDGHPEPETGAVVCRVAPSFVRFGNFELFASRGELEHLRALADFVIEQHYPHLGPPSPDTYAAFFDEVCERSAIMVAHWMRVGFVHGVMNTDNMSILGETIDYGPYGWLEDYDPDWTPNTTDRRHRRYRYANQPGVVHWNLTRLANALHPLIEATEPLQESIDRFPAAFDAAWNRMLADKLGLDTFDPVHDPDLVAGLTTVLTQTETDMTLFFRALADIDIDAARAASNDQAVTAPLADAYYQPATITDDMRSTTRTWLRAYAERVSRDDRGPGARVAQMRAANPKYVLRNYLAQLAIDDAEKGEYGMVRELLEMLRNPYTEQPEYDRFAEKRPEWARHRPGCSMLSCSS